MGRIEAEDENDHGLGFTFSQAEWGHGRVPAFYVSGSRGVLDPFQRLKSCSGDGV